MAAFFPPREILDLCAPPGSEDPGYSICMGG